MESLAIAICIFEFMIIATLSMYLAIQENPNKKLQIRISSLTSENIELKGKLEYYKQRIKTLKGFYHVSDKTLDLHTLKSSYPSKLVDKHFNELKKL